MKKVIYIIALLTLMAAAVFAQGTTGTITTCLVASEDAITHEFQPTMPHGSNPVLPTTRHTYSAGGGNGFYTTKSLYKFDLSSIPVGAIITGATLTLKTCATCAPYEKHYDLGGGTGNSANLERIMSTWAEGTVNWTTPISTTGTVPVASFGNASTAALVENVLPIMPATGGGDVSFLLSLADNGNYYHGINFASRENSDATIRPTLCVTYTMPATSTPCVMATSCIAKYCFSGNANDGVGANHGTVLGATLTADRFGSPNSAYYFNGAAEIDMGAATTFEMGTADFTLSVWARPVAVYPSNGTNSFTIVGKRGILAPNGGCDPGYGFGFNGATLTAGAGLRPDVPNCSSMLLASSPTVSNTTWHHYVAVYNRSGNMDLYQDNILVASTSMAPIAGTPTLNGLFGNFKVGSNDVWNSPMSIDEHFIGDIDDIGLYRCALSPIQIDSLFKDRSCFNGNGTVATETRETTLSAFTLSPNPTNDAVLLNYESIDNDIKSITVSNNLGQIVAQIQANNSRQTRIETTNYTAGMYFITIQTVDGLRKTQKLIVQH
jgi:Concanavalin A-like lectin/glucanases superfamily/Secretion system C-terminal sorting domain